MRALLAALILCAFIGGAMAETCTASVYSVHDHDQNGTRTASGIPLDDRKASVALPDRSMLRQMVEITNAITGDAEIVTVTDFGPFVDNRCADLSVTLAKLIRCPIAIDRQGRPHGLCPIRIKKVQR